MNRYAIVEAPSILGLKPTGVERLPAALLQHGLADECALVAPDVSSRRLLTTLSATR